MEQPNHGGLLQESSLRSIKLERSSALGHGRQKMAMTKLVRLAECASTSHPPNGPPPMRLLVKYHGVPKSIFILSKNLTLTDLQLCVLDWTIQQDLQDF